MRRKARPSGRAFFVTAIFAIALTGCEAVTDVLSERVDIANRVAAGGRLDKFFVDTGQFELIGYKRFGSTSAPEVSVYIEGDGLAFLSRDVVSRDPTPRDPVSLRLAVQDPSSNVAYLARPCQYQSPDRLAKCSFAYWTRARFAPEVVKETNTAVDAIVKASGAQSVRLIGYSGGGVLAALVASRRSDVSMFVTLASPLDHVTWTRLKRITPLERSDNPIDVSDRTTSIRQIHFIAGDDDVVPPEAVERFAARVREKGGNAKVVMIPDIDHRCCWQRRWPTLYATWLK